jgi:hypothetical protein
MLQPMVAINPKQAFSNRLHQACEGARLPVRGRAPYLAKITDVSKEAARKWLSGDAIPAMDHVVILAQHFAVGAEWLLTGQGQPAIGDAGMLTDEERRHIERLRCLPSDERARAFRVIEAMVSEPLRRIGAG